MVSSVFFQQWRRLFCWSVVLAANAVVSADVMRPHNLDYLDIETMRYYLQKSPSTKKEDREDYDVSVLFYAQWCNNCHAFAPIWDKISRLIHAGSKEANMIMGLFDCEKDKEHQEVCNEAGIKHYPTVKFYSLSGQVFHKKQRKTKKNPYPIPQHGTTFGGNWQYGDAVYDWLRTMSGLSAWHRAGWGQKLRSLFIKPKDKQVKKKDQLLPLGVPSGGAAAATSSATSGSATSGMNTAASTSSTTSALTEKKLEDLESKLKKYEDLAVRSNLLSGAMLHPITVKETSLARTGANTSLITATQYQYGDVVSNNSFTDAFSYLSETNAWAANSSSTAADDLLSNEDIVLRSCVMEISLDYCSRVTTRKTLDWIDKYMVKGDDGKETLSEEALGTFETDLMTAIEEEEPYCVLVEGCITSDYKAAECRPSTCPFKDTTACRYLTACFEPEIHVEYAKALKIETFQTMKDSEMKIKVASSGAEDTTTSSQTSSSGGSGWGLA